jgi:hypothetical protein
VSGRNRVVRSIETPSGERCVDIFLEPDGRFGFQECRRDAEDPQGWFPIGVVSDRAFETADAALAAAKIAVAWLGDVLKD